MSERKLSLAAIGCFCVTALIIAVMAIYAFRHRGRTNDVLSVTGLSKKNFASDLIVWKGSFTRRNLRLKDAYAALKRDQAIVKKYLVGKGISATELVFSAVDTDKEFETTYLKEGGSKSKFTGYRLTQSVQIDSKEVNKVEKVSREVTELINEGVEFRSRAPEYYYTGLADLKIEMLAGATEDAHKRAEQIAGKADGKLGKLKFSRMGVFQITAQNSSENYSWGGTFNTSAKNKTAAVTVKLQYELN